MLCSLLLSTCARRARARDPRAPHRALHERRFEHHVSIDVSKAARHLRPHARHRAACKRALGERCASGRADAFQAWRGVWQPHNERAERLGRPRPAYRPSGVYNQHPGAPRMNPQSARPAPGAPCARWRSGCRPRWTTAAPAATRRQSCRGRATPHCCARARSFAFFVQHKRCTAQSNIIEATCALHSRRPAGKPMQTTFAHKSSGDITATELPYQTYATTSAASAPGGTDGTHAAGRAATSTSARRKAQARGRPRGAGRPGPRLSNVVLNDCESKKQKVPAMCWRRLRSTTLRLVMTDTALVVILFPRSCGRRRTRLGAGGFKQTCCGAQGRAPARPDRVPGATAARAARSVGYHHIPYHIPYHTPTPHPAAHRDQVADGHVGHDVRERELVRGRAVLEQPPAAAVGRRDHRADERVDVSDVGQDPARGRVERDEDQLPVGEQEVVRGVAVVHLRVRQG
jgi:hypothetical protein